MTGPSSRGVSEASWRVRGVLLVFALTFAVAGLSLARNRQLRELGNMTDEWLYLGANLSVTGKLALGDEPMVLRPPGYPFFIALAMRTFAGTSTRLTLDYQERGLHALYLAQAIVLALAAALFFFWMSRVVSFVVAAAAALGFALNPYSVLLVGLVHYDVLHLLLVILGSGCLQVALVAEPPRARRLFLAGLTWGIATLVRPQTLIMPIFVWLGLRLCPGKGRTRAISGAAVFTLGLLVAVVPWTARNYAVADRLIPVNLQAWAQFWGTTVKVIGRHPNHYRTFELHREASQVFARVTGEREYRFATYLRFNAPLEDAYAREAISNLRQRPLVYLANVGDAFWTFNLHINSVLIKVFQYLQTPGAEPRREWFVVGNPQAFHDSTLSHAFTVYFGGLTGLAFLGATLAIVRRRRGALAPGLVYLCLCLTHSLFFMDTLYYYVKVPFVVFFAFLAVDEVGGRSLRVPGVGSRVPLRPVVAAAISVLGLWMTAWLLWSS